jgi:hypothetical protein
MNLLHAHESSVEALLATFPSPLVHVRRFLEASLRAVENLKGTSGKVPRI